MGFGTVPNSVDSSADSLFNLILPIVAIALAVIFSILAWFVSPTWLFIILKSYSYCSSRFACLQP
ncbi:MAG: hypothetical protein ACLTOX_06690 [Streptococcus thermophilus]